MGSFEQSSGEWPKQDAVNRYQELPVEGMTVENDVGMTSSLEEMQTAEQRQVLDIVAQIRKCGLDSILELPQLVVCGDQSAGKSSVLEALTEIPFPRNDNLCTRFATEIILRRAPSDSLTIKIIPDAKRPQSEQEKIKGFKESITDFQELPRIMDAAMAAMDVDNNTLIVAKPRAFAKDVLSVEIEGASRPQLTLVDIPGLIQTDTKGVTKADVELVAEITDQYISQDRTICLAVISAANDYANQRILTKVREADPDGNRTIGWVEIPTAPSLFNRRHCLHTVPQLQFPPPLLRFLLYKHHLQSHGGYSPLLRPKATLIQRSAQDHHEARSTPFGVWHGEGIHRTCTQRGYLLQAWLARSQKQKVRREYILP